ncbi:hypothetical protein, partial [Pseudomonas syringae group genomosp. 3]|uniref:hypothetical protein n=1 Tax=Pseudomonas syringae group genomosp. 3 TaxID=251701 RepID=UPI001EE3B488
FLRTVRRRILIKGRAAKLPRMSPDTLAQACFTAHRTAIAGGGLTIHLRRSDDDDKQLMARLKT